MSILGAIKNLFCKSSSKSSEPKQESKSAEPKAKVKDIPVAKVKDEPKKEKPVVKETEAPKAKAEPKKTEPKKANPTPAAKKTQTSKLQVPEDSALKRHFISALQMEIEADMPPRPTDPKSKSEYDAKVQTKLASLLG